MTILSPDGWLYSSPSLSCQWKHSPNFNARPPGVLPDLVVIHGISLPAGHFGGPAIDDLFLNRLTKDSPDGLHTLAGLRVSSHFLLRRSGAMSQFVSVFERAWHAGVSNFQGRENCNDFSIGIELEGTDDQAYSDDQMQGLAALCEALAQAMPSLRYVTGHAMIAPGRKTDPGPFFNWHGLSIQFKARDIPWQLVAKAAA